MTGLLFTYYGDDFTGSTDALEALASNSVETVLFLDVPRPEMLRRFAGCRAVGVAGDSRSRSPEWMSENLPRIFGALKALGAPVLQYKVCSTFDSSPRVGSIGRALDVGCAAFDSAWAPIVVAAPHLRRYVVFGNLFAGSSLGAEVYRIDRHPVMSRHPVTPMHEADLRRHLSLQTGRRIELLDILELHAEDAEKRLEELLQSGPGAVLFDGLDERSLAVTGRLLWQRLRGRQSFAVGSSGLTYALIRQWQAEGEIPERQNRGAIGAAERLIVASGSCSPVTEAQISYALANGFAGVPFLPAGAGAVAAAEAHLRQGKSVVLYTAMGKQGYSEQLAGPELSAALGNALREILLRTGVKRAVIAGGDTSSYAARQLGIEALTFQAQVAPGGPLCRAHASDPRIDGLELVLKGGQVGAPDFFEAVLTGRPNL